jgi:endonuclease YncB( thermonuclease family)
MPFDRDPDLTRAQRARGLTYIFMLVVTLLVLGWAVEALAEPTAFACEAPYIHDGDNIRCGTIRGRLYAIDAPEMPGACRAGRQCTPGDPYASRDHLRGLVAGKAVRCVQIDTDRYRRAILRCEAGGVDLSCSQVTSGHAVERYGRLSCPRGERK